MKHREVKQLAQELNALLNHAIEKKVTIFHFNYNLDRNMTKITEAIKAIDKSVNEELRELESKIYALGKAAKNPTPPTPETTPTPLKQTPEPTPTLLKVKTSTKTKPSKSEINPLVKSGKVSEKQIESLDEFTLGFLIADEVDVKRHKELMLEYDKAMDEENDLQIYLLDPSKLETLDIEFPFHTILKKFLPID